jgi:amino acid adenylation domain-containing protein
MPRFYSASSQIAADPVPVASMHSTASLVDNTWTLAKIVTEGAKRWPRQLALVDEHGSLTFEELAFKVRVAAHRLQKLGLRGGSRIAVLGYRSSQTAIAILAVASIGASYVGLDPDQPALRLRHLIADAEVSCVLVNEVAKLKINLSAEKIPVLLLSELTNESTASLRDDSTLQSSASSASLAYILYTSGSTGRPKGVPIQHRNVLAFFIAHNERIDIRPGDRCLSTGPFYFDVSVMDVLLPLHFGATVYFAPQNLVPSLLLRMLSRNRITHFYAVGTLLGLVTGDGQRLDKYDLSSLRMLQTGAEVCNTRVVNEWLKRYPTLGFLNSYGPTEATVGCLSFLKPYDGPITTSDCPIGKPHRGTTVKIINSYDRIQERVGEIGELIVMGSQVMNGYWQGRKDDLKSFVFIDGQRYYRTGDQVYVDNEANFHFVGRVDDEVKLKGFRIHLNEVRRTIEHCPRVLQVCIGTLTMPTSDELVAAVELSDRIEQNTWLDLVTHVRTHLPDYMVPTRWAAYRSFPRLPTGKTNRTLILRSIRDAIYESNASYYELVDGNLVSSRGN